MLMQSSFICLNYVLCLPPWVLWRLKWRKKRKSDVCSTACGFFSPYLGSYSRREGARGSSWSAQSTPRGTYNDSRGGQSNFNRGPLPPLRPLSSAGTWYSYGHRTIENSLNFIFALQMKPCKDAADTLKFGKCFKHIWTVVTETVSNTCFHTNCPVIHKTCWIEHLIAES